MHAINQTGLKLGHGTLITGSGPIGLLALAAARASGAHPLVITDIESKRLTFAKKFIPSCQTYLVDPTKSHQENAREIRKLFGETEYDAPETVLECTGVEGSVITAAFAVRRGGTVTIIGVGRDVINNLPFMHLSLAEVCIFPHLSSNAL